MDADNGTRRSAAGGVRALRCEEARILLMGHIDGELGMHDTRRLEDHLAVCVQCRREETEFRRLGEVTDEMLNEEYPALDVDAEWETIYRRLERSAGWLLLSVGLILVTGYVGWALLNEFLLNPEEPLALRVGLGATMAGTIVLLVSIGREVLFKFRNERYREVKR